MTTILYVHGLESGPRGRKTAMLEQGGFHVVSEEMPCTRAHLARDPWVWGVAAAAVLTVGTGARLAGPRVGWTMALGAVGAGATLGPSRLARRMFERSVAVQVRALAANRIDAVVGSSFGGAVALELLQRGAWTGPTLLLCPAHELMAARARRPAPAGLAALADEVAAHVLVVHGEQDETVPIAHSERLVQGSPVPLVRVDDDHRLTRTSTADGLRAWLERLGVRA